MRVYVQTDIEGVAGVTFFENRADDSIANYHHRLRMQRLLTGEVDAAVQAAFDAGATEVVVNDSHGNCYNIIFEDLDSRCQILHGRGGSQPFWLQDIDRGYDAMLLVGMHAIGGTEGALLAHSKWVLNEGELYLSEASMAAAIAGCYGTRTLFISGDQYITEEVGEKIPGITRVVVKEARGPYFSRSMIPAAACQAIYDGVTKALADMDAVEPYILQPPFSLNLYDSDNHAPPFRKILEEDVRGDDLIEVFKRTLDSFPWNNFGLRYVDGFRFSGT